MGRTNRKIHGYLTGEKTMAPKKEPKLDFDAIAKGLGAERRGKVKNNSGYFGALTVIEEVRTVKRKKRGKQK